MLVKDCRFDNGGAGSVPRLLATQRIDGQNRKCCTALIAVRVGALMNDLVERILNSYQSMRPLDEELVANSRKRISRYLENLTSAGQRDAKQLTIYGLAYLKELHEGRDPQFTGC